MQVPDKRLANLLNMHMEYRADANRIRVNESEDERIEERLNTSASILASVLQIPELALEMLCRGADEEVKENRLLQVDRGRFIVDQVKDMRK